MSSSRLTRYAIALLLALLPAMLLLSRDFGVTYDERVQQGLGERVWRYYTGAASLDAFEADSAHLNLYGGLFDLTAVALHRAAPQADPYVIRHLLTAVFGWAGVVFCWLIGRKFFGEVAGVLSAVLLVLAPRYMGHAMNNTKDIPFAACATAAMYFLVTLKPRPPFMSWMHAVKLGIAVGLALSIRPGALLFLGYAVIGVAFLLVRERDFTAHTLWSAGVRLLVVIAATWAIGLSAWPWAQASPLARPIQAFIEVARFPYEGAMLFRGEYLRASELPRSYVPIWFFITLPPVLIAGLVLAALRARSSEAAMTGILAALVVFPIGAIIALHSTVYDGIRHLLFLVPIMAVLAAAGWTQLLAAGRRPVRVIAIVLLAAGLLEPLVFDLRNHPNEAVYFSPIFGGPRAAFARYDMDYWGNCVLQATRWAAAQADRAKEPVGVSGNPWHLAALDAARFKQLYFAPYQTGGFHFDIRVMRGPPESLKEFAAHPGLVHSVTTADGTPLCVILQGPRYPELVERLRQKSPGGGSVE